MLEFLGAKDRHEFHEYHDVSWTLTGRTAEAFIGEGFSGTTGLKNPIGEDADLVDAYIVVELGGTVPVAKRGELFGRIGLRRHGLAFGKALAYGYLTTMTANRLTLGQFEDPVSGRGKKVDNEAASTLVNNTALTRTITVPTNGRWAWYPGRVINGDDVARAITIVADDGTDDQDLYTVVGTNSVNANGPFAYPNVQAIDDHLAPGSGPLPLSEGDRIRITWAAGGASSGGTARSSAPVEEWIEI